jgi:hypothetical protein
MALQHYREAGSGARTEVSGSGHMNVETGSKRKRVRTIGAPYICVSLLTNGYVRQHFLQQIRKAVRKHFLFLVASEYEFASESETLFVRSPSLHCSHPRARRLLGLSMVTDSRMWPLVALCGLGLAGVTHAATGFTIAAPASASVCAAGWDQLLTPPQRDAKLLPPKPAGQSLPRRWGCTATRHRACCLSVQERLQRGRPWLASLNPEQPRLRAAPRRSPCAPAARSGWPPW